MVTCGGQSRPLPNPGPETAQKGKFMKTTLALTLGKAARPRWISGCWSRTAPAIRKTVATLAWVAGLRLAGSKGPIYINFVGLSRFCFSSRALMQTVQHG